MIAANEVNMAIWSVDNCVTLVELDSQDCDIFLGASRLVGEERLWVFFQILIKVKEWLIELVLGQVKIIVIEGFLPNFPFISTAATLPFALFNTNLLIVFNLTVLLSL